MDLFLDTTEYLLFYDLSNEDLEELRKLIVVIKDGGTTLYLPDQVRDEYARNREGVIARSLKRIDEPKMPTTFPRVFMPYEGYAELRRALREVDKMREALKENVRRDAEKHSLHADALIDELFKAAERLVVTPDILQRARTRFDRGNPPGKDQSYGDAVNWEALLGGVPIGHELSFVTDDQDYRSPLDPARLRESMRMEWREMQDAEIVLYPTLSGLFKAHYPDIKLAADLERDLAVNRLIASSSYTETHRGVLRVSQFPDVTPAQASALIEAAIKNSQIYWIRRDPDVHEFFTGIARSHSRALAEDDDYMFWSLFDESDEENPYEEEEAEYWS